MNHEQSFQQLEFDYSEVRPAYPPQNSLFTDPQLAALANAKGWPEPVDDGQQSIPPGTAATLRPSSATEPTKHRRTRSGCYTCRQRRVKCDEARPQCARCHKGSRTCTYPEPPSKPKRGSSSKSDAAKATAPIAEASSSDEDDDDLKEPLVGAGARKSAADNVKVTASPRSHAEHKNAPSRKVPSQSYKQPLPSIERTDPDSGVGYSPPTDESSPQSPSHSVSRGSRHMENHTPESSLSPEKISLSHLPHMQRLYLDYLRNNITYHHYFFTIDANYFLHHILIEQALSYEPLLQAVVGFAAFRATLGKPNGNIQDFLGYYNRSVSLLLKSLASGQTHTDATLLTILQLATIEEYLGDWVNLLGHQKAAYRLLTELYSVDSITDNELRRKVLSWYSRFDLFAGFMSGCEPVLGREWLAAHKNYYTEQAAKHPESIDYKLELASANHRLVAIDMAMLFAKLSRRAITVEQFQRDNELLAVRIQNLREELEPLLSYDRYIIKSFEGAPERDEEDIVDPYRPGGLRQGPLWAVNFLMVDWLGTSIMHTYQTALILQKQPPPGLANLALEVCRLFEAIQYWPGSAPGSILSAQAGLGIAVVFLPKDDRHTMWCRKKLAAVESQGYTYPLTLRNKLASLWGISELRHSWLPNEEGYPPIVRSIRAFIEDRTQNAGHQPKAEDVRTRKGLFDKLNMNDSPDDVHG
ncbi:MAG: hypothetical protein L6R38_002111 [Xanthoria sp. 2 TBL-2021]|nr:MAG: hypothetical protein L6R38_002111 [Xanthoria sp. 2 TBL-2021]